jgi:hypothetical protein
MVTTLILISITGFIVGVSGILMFINDRLPKNPKFRILKKCIGNIVTYSAQFKNSLGWTSFWVSQFDGKINRWENWHSYEKEALSDIQLYKSVINKKIIIEVIDLTNKL